MNERHLTPIDRLIDSLDRGLRLVSMPSPQASRQSPATTVAETMLNTSERDRSASLMRVNHTGEICAQALYQGQALTAKLSHVRAEMETAAAEEIDHLAWCEERIHQLGSHTSYLNPLWYGLSFGLGAAAGILSDRISLGFVAATEERVCAHLESHLSQLPEQDSKSRAIVTQMKTDEQHHAETALRAGGYPFPRPIKQAMSLISKLMTEVSAKL